MIEVSKASFYYPNTDEGALNDVSLQINSGECVVLCGKSGCGKTTLTRLLNGLAPSFFDGKLDGMCQSFGLCAGEAAIEEYVPIVGSVFQNPKTQHFNIDTTAELAFPCENMGMNSTDIQERVRSCANEFAMEHLMDRSIFKLSGGEKQKIAFATACMLQPKLLVLDEPTSNLDYKAIQELHDMIAKKKSEGITIVIAEHRLAWLADIADRFCYFASGELQRQWNATEFLKLSNEEMQKMGLRPMDITSYRKRAKEKTKSEMLGSIPLMSAEHIKPLFTSVYKLLEDNGVFVFATQHPCFVTLTEKYMTPHSYYDIAIEGQPQKQCYYHRSLQDIFNLCFDTGFVIDGFYEECYFNKEIPDIIIVRAIKIER